MWLKNTIPFMGTIVSVGSGKNFADVSSAIAGTTGDVLILAHVGTYGAIILGDNFTRNIYIRGMETSPTSVLFKLAGDHLLHTEYWSGTLIYENVKIQETTRNVEELYLSWNNGTDPTIQFNKCTIDYSTTLTNNTYSLITAGAAPNTIAKLSYCEIDIGSGSIFQGRIQTWNISSCEINKCITNAATQTYVTSGSLAIEDYRTSATNGYGSAYGDYIFEFIPSPQILIF